MAIVIVKHLNKGGNLKAVARVGGSAGYVNAVRSAVLIAPDPEDDGRKLLLPMKANLAKRGKGLAYRLVELTDDEADIAFAKMSHLTQEERDLLRDQLFRLRWLGHVNVTADDALAQPNRKQQGEDIDRASEWLRAELSTGAKPSEGIPNKGNAALNMRHGLNWWRDRVFKDRLGGKPRKQGFGEGQVWVWGLPSQDSQCSQHSQCSQVIKGPWMGTEDEADGVFTPENTENTENTENAESTENPDTSFEYGANERGNAAENVEDGQT